MEYIPNNYEQKWRKYWQENQVYRVTEDTSKPKYYVLDMFPYPSGAGLHVGHPLGYIASDIYARFKRLKGFNVLHPMGFDSFGLPAEEYAIQIGVNPAESTKENIKKYKEQMSNLGLSFDWSREVNTAAPKYHKWTQWIFSLLYQHYYDKDAAQAKSIDSLKEIFSQKGNADINAAAEDMATFSADSWNEWNEKEQEEILMHYRLVYKKVGYVNWCEELGTVLANDQVVNGVSNRGGHAVEQKAMTQWYLRITAYAERLLEGLSRIDWTDSLKTIQRNWIGRSEGASMFFQIDGHDQQIEVFTTRPDTIYGATYMVLAPEHDLVSQLTTADQSKDIEEYIKYVKSKSEIDRMAEKEVTGAFTGAYAVNPMNNEKIPIWIGEYVLKDYGTGAIMAVPSDDERDQRFATKFGLKIIDVVDKSNYEGATLSDKLGVMINSGFLNGMEVPAAITAMCSKVDEMGVGKAKINYKMRDANFSRQRYWGEPFPFKYDANGLTHVLDISELPLTLPETDDFKPGGGKSPLARHEQWINAEPGFTREEDVMPAVAGSSWYFLRFMDPHNEDAFASKESLDYWQDVDLYLGGSEHAVAHLMYARCWHKFLYDLGYVPTDEPFKKLVNQGMIQGGIEFLALLKEKEDGKHKFICAGLIDKYGLSESDYSKIPLKIEYVQEYGIASSYLTVENIKQFSSWRPGFENAIFECSKGITQNGTFIPHEDASNAHLITISETGKMSKSKFNVINPDDVISQYGTDCFRMFEMFLGPLDQAKPWNTKGIDGVSKFLRKYWSLFLNDQGMINISESVAEPEELKALHEAIKKVSGDIENLSMNTAVSSFMICVNTLKKLNCNKRAILEPLTQLMAPFAPFITEELWHHLGHEGSIHLTAYPTHDEKYLVEDQIEYPFCINGKKRELISFSADMKVPDIQEIIKGHEFTQKWVGDKEIKKLIVVPGRMINIVV